MTPKQLDTFRRKLDKLAHRVRDDAWALLDQARSGSGGNGGGELSNVPLHLGDMGTDEQSYDMNAALLENEQYIAAEARAALKRLETQTFGVCEECGQPIAVSRLEAIPYTRFCVKCAKSDEITPQVNVNDGRPAGPPDTIAPEGEMQEDRSPGPETINPRPRNVPRSDVFAAGEAGGGTSIGGLAGTNEGHGDPNVSELHEAAGSSLFDQDDNRLSRDAPLGGPAGGAVGGTPARKRAN